MREGTRSVLTAPEKAVVNAVRVERLVETLRELVAIPSWNGNETPAQEWMAEEMTRIGLSVDRWPIDLEALSAHPAFGVEVERASALGVVGVLEGTGAGPTLVLNGHVDVVPPGDESLWRHPPFEPWVEDGKVWGRGAVDMKGGLACALEAVRAVRDSGVGIRGRVLVQSVIGEEDGGCGALATLLRGHRGDGAVVLEPTRQSVVTAQSGACCFRIRIQGAAAHGAVRAEGESALERFLPVFHAIRELEAARNLRFRDEVLFPGNPLPAPICVGIVRAGEWASSVPERLVAEGRFGVGVNEDPDMARRELQAAVEAAAGGDPWLRDHPPELTWWGGQFLPARIPEDHPLVGMVREAHRDSGGGILPPIRGVPYGSDMRLLVNEGGIPTVLYGPGDVAFSHRPDEHVAIQDLEEVARALALLGIRFCGEG
jgi:acetylornithine deacetylase